MTPPASTTSGIIALGIGIRRRRETRCLDVHYPIVVMNPSHSLLTAIESMLRMQGFEEGSWALSDNDLERVAMACHSHKKEFLPSELVLFSQLFIKDSGFSRHPYAEMDVVFTVVRSDQLAIPSVEDAYLRLHLLSRRLVKPHGISLQGLFAILPNLAWTSVGPVLPEDLDLVRITVMTSGKELTVTHVDKFPYLVNYHIPSGVRIASGSQVRLGAYLGEGTTVMPAGYVNFNAGTAGKAMVEGRISSGVMVDHDSDVGGGASIMGTLSGGNQHVISIGPNCLLGANSGVGISLGRGCTVEAGTYVTAGMKVAVLNEENVPVDLDGNPVSKGNHIVKAEALSGRDYLLFIRHSQTGQLICKPNTAVIELNAQLHQN